MGILLSIVIQFSLSWQSASCLRFRSSMPERRMLPKTSRFFLNKQLTRQFTGSIHFALDGDFSSQTEKILKGNLIKDLGKVSRGGGLVDSDELGPSFAKLTDWIGKTPSRCWGILFFAIFVEIYATTLMKIAMDARCAAKTALSSSLYLISLICFGLSLRQIDVSIAYAIWSALGTLFISVAGMTLFGEARSIGKVLSIGLILIGVIGLNLQGGAH